jgi:phosphoribosyl-AMP cyclohydrolase
MSGAGEQGRTDEAGSIEETEAFEPRFDANGLVPAIATDAVSGEVLMLAYMNALAIEQTLATGIAHYWSRSRQVLWRKGETSGNEQRVVSMRTDCDQDAIWLSVEVAGPGATCHTGRRSCFYREVVMEDGGVRLQPTGGERLFDPAKSDGRD